MLNATYTRGSTPASLFDLFPIWGRRITFSISLFSDIVLLLSLLVSHTHVHVIITTSSSVFLSTWPNHPSIAYLIFTLVFATAALARISSFLIFSILFISIIHLNISVISSKFCSALLSAGLMTVLYAAALSIMGIILSYTIPAFSRPFPYPAPTRCLTSSSQPRVCVHMRNIEYCQTCRNSSIVRLSVHASPVFKTTLVHVSLVWFICLKKGHPHPSACTHGEDGTACFGVDVNSMYTNTYV